MKITEDRWQPLRALLAVPVTTLLFTVGQQAHGQQKLPLAQAIRQIEQRFNANLSYEHNLLNGKFVSSESLKGNRLEEVLKKVLYPNQLVFLYVDDRSYSIVPRQETDDRPQQGAFERSMDAKSGFERISGTVRSASGKPIPFASIWIKDTRKGGKADEDGRFMMYDLKPTDELVFTAVGYKTTTVLAGNRDAMAVIMEADENMLEEVLISTGYQKISKERATGSATVITSKELEKSASPNLIQRMDGLAPGLQVWVGSGDRTFTYNNNQMGIYSSTRTIGQNDYSLTVRGVGSIDTDTEKSPLVVIDGAISNIDLNMLNPNDVDNITILKDAAAASIYGVRAANGVIVVTTKKGSKTGVPRINFSFNTAFSGKPDLNYLRTMNSEQMIEYQEELVAKNILNSNNIASNLYMYASSYYPGEVATAAIRLKMGQITQADYDAIVNPLKQIDNRSQIQQYLLRPMNNQQYNLSISNGTENNNYFYSASYANENPFTKGENGKRFTFNLNNNWKIFKIATLSTSVRGTFFRNSKNGIDLGQLYDANSSTLLPYQLLADQQGNGIYYDRVNPGFTQTLGPAYKDWRYNYLQELQLLDNVQKDNNYSAVINLEVPIYKGLKGSVSYANERSFGETRSYDDENSYKNRLLLNQFTPIGESSNTIGINKGGIYNIINSSMNNYTVRGQLNYDATFAQKHEITAIAGSEIRQTQAGQGMKTMYGYNPQTGFNTSVSYMQNSYNTLMGYLSGLSGSPTQADRTRRFLSYFSNAAYTLNGKYTLSGSVRYDDYNNFGLDRSFRATPLWSSGLKWNMAKERFMQYFTWLNRLGLRATYGVNGNITQDVRPFTYISLDNASLNPTNQPSASIIAIANPQLRWEKTYVTNFGLDFGLLDNRLTGSLDYYRKNGKDLLYGFPIAAPYVGTIGSGSLKRNTASMSGHGIDLGLTGTFIRTVDWNLDATLNFSYNTNKITDNRFDPKDISTFTYSYTPIGIGYLEGYPSDKIFVFRHAGLDEKGLTQIYNKNNEIIPVTKTLSGVDDLKYAGRRVAPYFGSLRTNLRYRQWSVYALISYQFGNIFMKPSIESYMAPSRGLTIPKFDLSADIANRWRQPGDEAFTNVPGLTVDIYSSYSLQRYQYSDINVLKGDYIRLREISLSYGLPKSILNRLRVENVQLAGSVRNLGLIWTANKEGYDPDYVNLVGNTTNLRPVPSYNFSINVSF
ncbi:SusC/RagA family TonB-linked outer membrane protein [Sphingobacterium thalpophilum]|uniref:SusC/RagA family TonB-linked outer membrane protein n=1 Tax=Sphingobacterium thalpophilum TaxID=259 RepID=UPI003DA42CD7